MLCNVILCCVMSCQWFDLVQFGFMLFSVHVIVGGHRREIENTKLVLIVCNLVAFS